MWCILISYRQHIFLENRYALKARTCRSEKAAGWRQWEDDAKRTCWQTRWTTQEPTQRLLLLLMSLLLLLMNGLEVASTRTVFIVFNTHGWSLETVVSRTRHAHRCYRPMFVTLLRDWLGRASGCEMTHVASSEANVVESSASFRSSRVLKF